MRKTGCMFQVKTGDIVGFADAIRQGAGNLDNENVKTECIKQAEKFDVSKMQTGYMNVYKRLTEGRCQQQ